MMILRYFYHKTTLKMPKSLIIALKFPCLMNMFGVMLLQGFVAAPFEFRARPILFIVYYIDNATLVHDLLHHDLLNLCINRMITMHNKCLCQEKVAIL